VAAAGALWRIERSLDALPILTARIDGPSGNLALQEIAAMGKAASQAAPYVATFLEAPDPHWWRPTLAAIALWQMAGDADRAPPVLKVVWDGNPATRSAIVRVAAGPLLTGLTPQMLAVLAAPGTSDPSLISAIRAILPPEPS
jgi:hypothetical protein